MTAMAAVTGATIMGTSSGSSPTPYSTTLSNSFDSHIQAPALGDVKGSPIKHKLTHLSSRFSGFEQELNLSRNKKKSEDEERIIVLQTQLTNLQASVALESKNRATSVNALQAWLTDRIAQWTDAIERPMLAKLDALNSRIDQMSTRIDAVDRKHAEDRETFPKLVDARCSELIREIADLKNAFTAQIAEREEKEKRILLKLQDTAQQINTQFNTEKQLTEKRVAELRRDIEDEVSIRTKGSDLLKTSVEAELTSLKADISKETAARESADEDLVSALNHYTAALQDGIKIVSTQ